METYLYIYSEFLVEQPLLFSRIIKNSKPKISCNLNII